VYRLPERLADGLLHHALGDVRGNLFGESCRHAGGEFLGEPFAQPLGNLRAQLM
jgi:hypothetical protein